MSSKNAWRFEWVISLRHLLASDKTDQILSAPSPSVRPHEPKIRGLYSNYKTQSTMHRGFYKQLICMKFLVRLLDNSACGHSCEMSANKSQNNWPILDHHLQQISKNKFKYTM